MREKIVKLARQAAKLLGIELFVPGGTLVVLTILLARRFASGKSSRLLVPFSVRVRDEDSASGN